MAAHWFGTSYKHYMSLATQLEGILRTPRWLVTAVSLAGMIPLPPMRSFDGPGWHVTVAPAYTPGVIVMFATLLWLFALYTASVRRTPARLDPLRFTFAVTAISYSLTVALAHALYFWRGEPPNLLLIVFCVTLVPAAIGILVSMALSANALADFEASAPLQEPQSVHPFLSVLFLPVGIWFIHRRIQAMLASPATLETSP